jgi:VanZ family protein
MFILHRLRRYMLLTCILTWVAAFVATHVPAESVPQTGLTESSSHLLGFLGLTGVFWGALAAYGTAAGRRMGVAIVVMAVYAAVDEITQGLVRRSPAVSDWLMDIIGTLCAVAALEAVARLIGVRRSPPPSA